MRGIDFVAMQKIIPVWAKDLDVRNIALLSESSYNYNGSTESSILALAFPGAQINTMDINAWNLNDKHSGRWDLIWAAGVFLCARDPARWIENCLESAQNLMILDVIEGWRNGNHEQECVVWDGDVMRYHLPGHRAKWPATFDLGSLESMLKKFYVFPDVKDTTVPNNRNFIALITRDS